jgi:tRNA (guanine-N7-)-methyltransferase
VSESGHPAERPRIRSYVLRAGRVGSGQARALATLGPRFVVPYSASVPDFDAIFGRTAARFLEIGFGMGEGLAQTAAEHPENDYLGVEVHTPGVGALLKAIGERNLTNVRIVQHDAVEVLENMIAPDTLAGVHIFFPDPWHKKRHHKRRLIQPAFVRLLVSRVAPGGYVHLATDWQDYAAQMLAVLSAEPGLRNTAADFAPRPQSRPLTKFEQRGRRLGHGTWDLLFEKR